MAGCNGLFGGSAESSRTVESGGERTHDPADTVVDPPMVRRRVDADVPPIRPPDFERERADGSARERLSFGAGYAVVDSRSAAARLDADDEDGAVAAFVDATEFERETLFLQTRLVAACYRLRLCHVSWGPDEIETEYVRRLRPYDERCASDAQVFESRLIRLPVALDGDAINSFATGVGTGGCGHGARGASGAERDASADAAGSAGGDGR
ncbi:hypothetical protein GCM10009017_08100 [Halarchaeum rubridurum]|uniref:Uncharacterized protein n=1 Tax=Halarchaeum rubridurum TaxID=489911 RepID=A0A830FYM3_9EURY|nr:hypothetical protein GCM10009017_08100 [Halarchaeum rubridurum]